MKYEKAKWWVDHTGSLCMGNEQIFDKENACRADGDEYCDGNIMLMAAAPDLFEALRNLGIAVYAMGLEPKLKKEMEAAFFAIDKAQKGG